MYAGVFNYRTKDYIGDLDEDFWVYNTCRNYAYLDKQYGYSYDIDSKTRTIMAFGIIAPVIGAIACIFSYFVPCNGRAQDSRLKGIGLMFALTGIFQGITLLVPKSSICLDNPVLQVLESEFPEIRETFPDECEWAAGYKLGIASVVLWLVAGVWIFVVPAPVISPNQPTQTQEVTYQQNPDGTVQETNVVVVKGAPVDDKVTPVETEVAGVEEAK